MAKKQNYLHGAAILTVSVAVIKILGFIYKVPLGNILGDEGFAHYNAAFSVYNVVNTVATAGLPVALSKLISEATALRRPNQVRRTFSVAFTTFVILGVLGTLLLLLFPAELGARINHIQSAQSIQALAPTVFLACVLSAYRGYIQGHSDMTPTSVSQVIEVAVKVAFGLPFAWLLIRQGRGLPEASAAAIAGVPVGTAFACMYIIYKKRKLDKEYDKPAADPDVPDSGNVILKNLLSIGVPIAVGSSITSLITLIDTTLLLSRLHNAVGLSETQTSILYGVYSKAITLYNLPAAFITSLTISLVPAIAASLAEKKYGEARETTESSLRIASVLALPMGLGMTALSAPIMEAVFPGSAAEGPLLLTLLGVASYFVCISLMTTAILQAYGRERFSVYTMLIGGAVKVAVNWFLVGQPSVYVYGAPIGTLCCYFVMSALNYGYLSKQLSEPLSLRRILTRPLFSSLLMGLAAYVTCFGLMNFLGARRLYTIIAMGAGILTGVALYLALIIVTRAVTLEDMRLIPGGEKLAKILRIK